MNKIILMGRLTSDVKLNNSQSGKQFAKYTLAVNRMKEGEADFIPCVVFDKKAEFASKYFTKGTRVLVSGSLQIDKVTKDNKSYTNVAVLIDTQEFADTKKDSSNTNTSDSAGDDELPFE